MIRLAAAQEMQAARHAEIASENREVYANPYPAGTPEWLAYELGRADARDLALTEAAEGVAVFIPAMLGLGLALLGVALILSQCSWG